MKILLMILLPFSMLPLCGQSDTVQLPEPEGVHTVGTMIYEWTDETRSLNYTSHQGDKRTLIVQLWYPASIDSQAVKAPYALFTTAPNYQRILTNSCLRLPFREDIEDANLILFSPGRGTERFLYTTIIEELVSHGFVVASVDMPQIGYVTYQDGFTIKPSSRFRPPRGMMGGDYEKVDAFFEEPTAIGYQDLEFVYHKLVALNEADPNNRFTGKINTREVGIFGHSLGGRIAGKFAAENKSVKAYLSMEGIPPRDIRYEGKLTIPVAMLCSSGTWPYAKENYYSLINNRSNTVYMIELVNFGHNSVTDQPFIYPSDFKNFIAADTGLAINRLIVTHYFQTILEGTDTFRSEIGKLEQIKYTEHK